MFGLIGLVVAFASGSGFFEYSLEWVDVAGSFFGSLPTLQRSTLPTHSRPLFHLPHELQTLPHGLRILGGKVGVVVWGEEGGGGLAWLRNRPSLLACSLHIRMQTRFRRLIERRLSKRRQRRHGVVQL